MAKKNSQSKLQEEDQSDYNKFLLGIGDGRIGPELVYLFKSRYKIIYITTNEETRVLECLKGAAGKTGSFFYKWDCINGMVDSFDGKQISSSADDIHKIPEAALGWIIDIAKKQEESLRKDEMPKAGNVFALLDFNHFLRGEGEPGLERLFKNFVGTDSHCNIVIISSRFECPIGLQSDVTLIDFPYPSRSEIKVTLDELAETIPVNFPQACEFLKNNEEAIIDSATGLTLTEAENAFAKTLVKNKTFHIPTILEEKQQIIRKHGILEYKIPRFSFDDIGGLDALKDWLKVRKVAFSKDASEFGLDPIKGLLLIGSPGVGKSLFCAAIGSYYEIPHLKLDFGSIFGSLVGESESRIREVIKISESLAPCCLQIDEIDKALGGIKSSGSSDGGTSLRVFGTLLNWMQEKIKQVFIVCTANDITAIPPEFTRAGRFDEIFFLDLPNIEQREDIVKKLLLRKKRNPDNFDLSKIALESDKYSPAEIEKGIGNALFVAFSDGKRELNTQDIISEIKKFQPLYFSRKTEIDEMREWAVGKDGQAGRAVLANSVNKNKETMKSFIGKKRSLDFSESDI